MEAKSAGRRGEDGRDTSLPDDEITTESACKRRKEGFFSSHGRRSLRGVAGRLSPRKDSRGGKRGMGKEKEREDGRWERRGKGRSEEEG